MQFRLCNAPLMFQRMIDEVLIEELVTGCMFMYVNDILIATETREEN